MLRKAVISVMILSLAVTVWGAAGHLSASPHASVCAAVPPNATFGLCFISAAENLADETRYDGALATGAQWDRWPLYWHWVDEGGYDGYHDGGIPHNYDELVTQEIEHSLTPIAILMGTPDRRATGGSTSVPPPRVQDKAFPVPGRVTPQQGEVSTAASPPVGLFEPVFADGTDVPGPGKAINQANSWADFVSTTVQRYKPGGDLAQDQGWDNDVGIRHWEIWNEPDLTRFWSGTVEEYYRLLEVAYRIIKHADPEAMILLGGLAFFEKPNWLSDLLALTGGDPSKAYFDIVSSHYYWSIYNTEYWLWRTRNTLNANGLSHVPIWITESGVLVWDDFPATYYGVPSDSPWRSTMEEQAAYVIQNAALAFHYGVERYYHFMLHDDCGNTPQDAFGLRQNSSPHTCNPPGTNPQGKRRPSYAAYQLAAEQFRDLIPLWRAKGNGQDQIAFYRADDSSRVLALWATGGVTVTATVSATGETGQLYWIEPTPSPLGTTGISRTLTLTPTGGIYTLMLSPATNHNSGVPGDINYYIGGRPFILVERDTLTPTAQVEPLPSCTPQDFTVHWRGSDDGSGIAGYDVFYNVDGGPLMAWITETLDTSSPFTGTVGSTYGFAVRARDRAGNVGPEPSEPQAQTTVVAGAVAGGRVTDNAARPAAEAQVTLMSGAGITYTVVTDEEGLWRTERLPLATYTVTASAPGYGQWPPRWLTLSGWDILNFDLNLPPLTNLVLNGDFEAGLEGWESTTPTKAITSTIAFDGRMALLLGQDLAVDIQDPVSGCWGGNSTVRQQISIPEEMSDPRLSFVYKLDTSQTTEGKKWFEVIVAEEGTPPEYLIEPRSLWQATDWQQRSLDLSQFQGHTFYLIFNLWQCAQDPPNPTLAFVDEVSVGSAKLPYRIFLPLVMQGGEIF